MGRLPGSLEEIIEIKDLYEDYYYNFNLYVKDNDTEYASWEGPIQLNFDRWSAKSIYIPNWKNSWEQFQNAISILPFGLGLVILLVWIVLRFINLPPKLRIRKRRLIGDVDIRPSDLLYVIFLIICFIAYTRLYSSNIENNIINIFLKSLPFFMLFIYIIIFVSFIYLTRRFFEIIEDDDQLRLLIFNGFFMAALLWSIVFIISRSDPSSLENYLRLYYSSMGEIFATILAIVAAFYTAMPKNIINIPHNKEVDKIYIYPTILHRFVIVYGFILALSLWGLSAGTSINFSPYIVFDLYNLASISVFFTTLMMIPPAITCLYELLRVIIFRGNVVIRSVPSGANIYINGRDIGLKTPNTVILRSSKKYEIRLVKENYKVYPLDLPKIVEGTQQEHSCRLEKKH